MITGLPPLPYVFVDPRLVQPQPKERHDVPAEGDRQWSVAEYVANPTLAIVEAWKTKRPLWVMRDGRPLIKITTVRERALRDAAVAMLASGKGYRPRDRESVSVASTSWLEVKGRPHALLSDVRALPKAFAVTFGTELVGIIERPEGSLARNIDAFVTRHDGTRFE